MKSSATISAIKNGKAIEINFLLAILNPNVTQAELKIALEQASSIDILDHPFDFGSLFSNINLGNATALEYAIYSRNTSLMMKLLAAGADPNKGKHQPLMLAISVSTDDTVIGILLNNHLINKKIAAKKVNVNHINPQTNLAPIHTATSLNKINFLKKLLADPDINVHIKVRNTEISALALAAESKHMECLDLIFDKIALEEPVLSNKKLNAIKELIVFEQSKKAVFLLNKISDARKTQPNFSISTALSSELESFFRLMLNKKFDPELYHALMNAGQMGVNHKISMIYFSRKNDICLLGLVSAIAENEIDVNWVTFLLDQGANPNDALASYPFILNPFTVAVCANNIKLCEIMLESGKVHMSSIRDGIDIAFRLFNNKNLVHVLEKYCPDTKIEFRYHIDEPSSSPLFLNALIEDDAREINALLLNKNIFEHYFILYRAIRLSRPNIIELMLKSLSPFSIVNKNNLNIFTILLLEEDFQSIDTLWKFCLNKNIPNLNEELILCKQRVLNEFSTFSDINFQKILNKIELLQDSLVNEATETNLIYRNNTCGQVFFNGTSSRKYLKDELNVSFSKDDHEEEFVAPKKVCLPNSTPYVEPTWFNGKMLDHSLFKKIENPDSLTAFLLILPGTDPSPDQVFENISRYRFGHNCIMPLSNLNFNLSFTVSDELFEFTNPCELKSTKTPDRLFVVSRSSDDGCATLYIAFKYLDGGLHTNAHMKQLCESLKNAKPLELDFLVKSSLKCGMR